MRILNPQNLLVALLLLPTTPQLAEEDSPSVTPEKERPLVTAEYAIAQSSWQEHIANASNFAEELKAAIKTAKPYKKAPAQAEAYLAAAQVLARHIGHHDMAFLFLRRARRFAATEALKNRNVVLTEVDALEERLAQSKLDALMAFGDPELPATGSLMMTCNNNIFRLREITNTPIGDGDYELAPYFEDLKGGAISQAWKQARGVSSEGIEFEDLFEPNGAPQHAGVADLFATSGGGYFLDADRSPECDLDIRETAGSCKWGELKHIKLLYIHPRGSTVYSYYEHIGDHGKVQVIGEARRRGVMVTTNEWWIKFMDDMPSRYPLQDQMDEIQKFAAHFPQLHDQLRAPVSEVIFSEAKENDELAMFRAYVEGFPDGPHIEEARGHLERKRFELATADNTEESYRRYLQQYPEGLYSERARDQLEIAQVKSVVAAGDADALSKFLGELARDKAIVFAKAELMRLRYLEASNTNTISSYEQFIRNYPDSIFVADAKKGIAEIRAGQAFNSVRRANKESGFEKFLLDYPDSRFVPEARAMVAFFAAKEEPSIPNITKFLSRYHDVRVISVVRSEYAAVMKSLRNLVENEETATEALLLLHQEEPDERYLLAAFTQAGTAEQEERVLKKLSPAERLRVFPVSQNQDSFDANQDWDLSFLLGRESTTIRPEFTGYVSSKAKLGAYRVTVKYNLPVHYKRYYSGVTWFNPSYKEDRTDWTKVFTAEAAAKVNQGDSPVVLHFKLPEILVRKRPGIDFVVGYSTDASLGFQSVEITSVDLIE